LPVAAARVNQRTVLVNPGGGDGPVGGVGLYARVSSHDQGTDLDRQVGRLSAWAAKANVSVVRVEAEVGSSDDRCAP
jgi:putative resolvase